MTLGGANYLPLSGTSMAAPVVAGSVALMLQAAPDLSPDTVKIQLMRAAVKQWNPSVAYNPYSRGAGLIDIPAALQQTVNATQPATSPTLQRQSAQGQFALQGSSALWGDTALCGANAVW